MPLLRVVDALRRARGSSAAPLTDGGEVAFGFQAKRTHVTIEPDGVSLLYSTAPPSKPTAPPPSLPWWRPGDVPELTLGLAWDHEHRIEEAFDADAHVEHVGFEACVFRLLALRVGYVSDQAGDVQGITYGGRVSLPIGPWGSVGYDVADVPRPSGFDRQLRRGWSVWLDPARFWGGSM